MFLVALPFSASANVSEINTPEDYINYLSNSMSMQSNSSEQDVLEQFKALSADDQQKFVDYISDPDVAASIFKAMSTGEKTKLYGGDVEITFEKGKAADDNISLSSTTTYRQSDQAKTTVLGIDIITVEVYIQYRVSGTNFDNRKITDILNGGGRVLRNWYPSVTISVDDDSPYIQGNQAYQTSYFEWNFVHPKLGFQIGVNTFKIWGNPHGGWGSDFTKS